MATLYIGYWAVYARLVRGVPKCHAIYHDGPVSEVLRAMTDSGFGARLLLDPREYAPSQTGGSWKRRYVACPFTSASVQEMPAVGG